MPLTPMPYFPLRGDPQFSFQVDAVMSWIGTQMVPALNAFSAITSSIFNDGSAATPGAAFASDADTGIFRPASNVIAFATGGTEAMRITGANFLLVNCTQNILGMGNARLNIQGPNNGGTTAAILRTSADALGPSVSLAKSRGVANDDYTIAQANDALGNLNFQGADGATTVLSARIHSYVMGTPAAGDVRGALVFSTGSAAGAVAARLTIDDTDLTTTLPFHAPQGTAGAPTYSFTGWTNLGMYRGGANIISFASGGQEAARIDASRHLLAVGGGIGYAAGAGRGGVVSQLTSRATGVTLNTHCGDITMFSAAGSATPASFVVTNSAFAATDNVILNVKSGATNTYVFQVTAKGTGSFTVTYWTTGGTAVDAPILSFEILKGATN